MEDLIKYFDNLKSETRDKAIEKYRELLLEMEKGAKINFQPINEKIIARWSVSGLEYIKYNSFVRKAGKKRIWVTAKNTKFKFDAFLVSMSDFWATCRVGFDNYTDAKKHAEMLIS